MPELKDVGPWHETEERIDRRSPGRLRDPQKLLRRRDRIALHAEENAVIIRRQNGRMRPVLLRNIIGAAPTIALPSGKIVNSKFSTV